MSRGFIAYRCGWRVELDRADEFGRYPVRVSRGQWHCLMDGMLYTQLPDDAFVEIMDANYREAVFEQLQQDLDVIARQLLGQMERHWGIPPTDVPYTDVKQALDRYRAVAMDIRESSKPPAPRQRTLAEVLKVWYRGPGGDAPH